MTARRRDGRPRLPLELGRLGPLVAVRYRTTMQPTTREAALSEPAERMRGMRARRRARGLRELRLIVPDARLRSVRRRVAAQVDKLDRHADAEALDWIEAVSESDAPMPDDAPR